MFYLFVIHSLQAMTPIPVFRRTYWTRTLKLKELSRCAILRCDPITGILMWKPKSSLGSIHWLKSCVKQASSSEEREEGGAAASSTQGNLEKMSNYVTCGICMDNVYEKSHPRNNVFGILPNCNHSFCIQCISTWRKMKDYGPDVIK